MRNAVCYYEIVVIAAKKKKGGGGGAIDLNSANIMVRKDTDALI